jgi:hypothetical protein
MDEIERPFDDLRQTRTSQRKILNKTLDGSMDLSKCIPV